MGVCEDCGCPGQTTFGVLPMGPGTPNEWRVLCFPCADKRRRTYEDWKRRNK